MEFGEFVLAASTADLGEEPAARAHADAVEYRLDRAADGLAALAAYDGELPLLVTNRVEGEGGAAPDAPARLDVLEAAIEQPRVAGVDVELSAIRNGEGGRVVEHAHEHGVAVVVSTHNFEHTPGRERLREQLEAASEHGDIAKLAVTASDRGDVLDLLAVTHELSVAGVRVANSSVSGLKAMAMRFFW